VVLGIGLIMVTESQNVEIIQKENTINTIHSNKEKEMIQVIQSGNTFSFHNSENIPVTIKYFRILDNQGNLVTRIPYTQTISSFANSSINLIDVIPQLYMK
jgi:hypothetical protein